MPTITNHPYNIIPFQGREVLILPMSRRSELETYTAWNIIPGYVAGSPTPTEIPSTVSIPISPIGQNEQKELTDLLASRGIQRTHIWPEDVCAREKRTAFAYTKKTITHLH